MLHWFSVSFRRALNVVVFSEAKEQICIDVAPIIRLSVEEMRNVALVD